jgi:hypothetical protein
MRFATCILLLALCQTAAADVVYRYPVFFAGQTSGEQTTTVHGNGQIEVEFHYRDNGRGPDSHETIRLADDGSLLSYRLQGRSTYGAPLAERFAVAGDRAAWKARSDQGQISVTTPAMYVPIGSYGEDSGELLAIFARALVNRPQRSMAALPSGTLKLDSLRQLQLQTADGPVALKLYAIGGIGIQPSFVWLRDDPSMRLAAYITPGSMNLVDETLRGQVATLEKTQIAAEIELQKSLQQRLAHHLNEPVVIRNVRVFDPVAGKLGTASDVYVYRGRIASVYPTGTAMQAAGTIIEGKGRTLLASLFDMHSHEDGWNALLQIAGGVTVSRDMGSDNQTLWDLKDRIDAGEICGPTIMPMGFIEGESPFAARGGFVVKDLQGAKDAIDWYAQRGYPQIKLYNSFHPDWVKPTAEYAHLRGLRVGGHVPSFMKAADAVRDGYDEVSHINQVLLNFYVTPQTDTRTLARFTLIGDHVHSLDLDSKPVADLLRLFKDHGTYIDLTLAIFEPSFTQLSGEPNPNYGMIAEHVPISVQRSWRINTMDATSQNIAKWRASYAKMLEFTGRLYRAGVPILAGTDDIAGFTLHRELELYVKAGIPPAEVLRIATWNAAKHLNVAAERGSVEPGKLADLILIDGDPTTQISDLRKISLVMKGGTAYFPAEVYEALGVKRFAEPAAVSN